MRFAVGAGAAYTAGSEGVLRILFLVRLANLTLRHLNVPFMIASVYSVRPSVAGSCHIGRGAVPLAILK